MIVTALSVPMAPAHFEHLFHGERHAMIGCRSRDDRGPLLDRNAVAIAPLPHRHALLAKAFSQHFRALPQINDVGVRLRGARGWVGHVSNDTRSIKLDQYPLYRMRAYGATHGVSMASNSSEQQSQRLRAAAKARGYKKASELSRALGTTDLSESLLRSLMNGTRGLTAEKATTLARFLHVSKSWLLFGEGSPPSAVGKSLDEIHRDGNPKESVAGLNENAVAYLSKGKRTEGVYTTLTELVNVIGKVQAGAWSEAYQLPETEWMEMRLPVDPRYPGVPRYGLINKGLSMLRVCRDGGVWVFVLFSDLRGVGPQPGDYVIVERRRADGLIEATAKKLELRGGRPWLCPETDEPGFEAFPIDGGTDVDEIKAIGLVTEIVNRVGR